ncbi:MAG: hypothetical protein WAU91_10470, partial [Desulfatitalea sp.]
LTVAAFLHRRATPAGRVAWLALAGGSAYGLTVAVNAARILVAIALYDANVAWGLLTAERLHRLAGIVVYFAALGLYYQGLHRIISRNSDSGQNQRSSTAPPWLPWLWYLLGAVAVPTVHQIYRGHPWPSLEYCLTVLIVSGLMVGLGAPMLRKMSRHRHRSTE